jgi:drug/metabolite transporter (DMT)-like permease
VVAHLPPMTSAALRFTLASVLMAIILLLKENNLYEVIKKNLIMYIILGIIGVAGFSALFFYGLKYTSPINGALIMATNPLVTSLLAAILLKEPIQTNQRIGMALSLVGVILVISQGSIDKLIHLQISTGDFIIMLANISWGFYGVLSRRYLKDSKPLITTAMTMIFGTLVLVLLASTEFSWQAVVNQNISVYLSLIFMAIFGSVLAYLFWNYGITHLGAAYTSRFFNLVPVATVGISFLGNEEVLFLQIIGGVLVIIGVLYSNNVFRNFNLIKLNKRADNAI